MTGRPRGAIRQQLFGQPVQQTWSALYVMEGLLSAHKEIKWICEIGTGFGSLWLYLAVWGCRNRIPCLSIDKVNRTPPGTQDVAYRLGSQFVQADCFAPAGRQKLLSYMSQGKGEGFLLCDGGDKPREIAEFGPQVPAGTIVLAHDYGTEILPADVEAVPELEYYQPWHDQSMALETLLAVLRRK